MKEVLIINTLGFVVGVETSMIEINELIPVSGKDPDNNGNVVIMGYKTTKRVPEGCNVPVYDFDLEEFKESLTPEEIEALHNAPQPETDAQKIAVLETTNAALTVRLAYAEQAAAHNSLAQQELLELLIENGVIQ